MRFCSNCGSNRYHAKGYCNKCYCKLITNPKWRSINNKRRIKFKGKHILLKENPRTGVCSLCNHHGRTNTHHFAEYHDDDPLKDTIELCVSCHHKAHGGRLRRVSIK